MAAILIVALCLSVLRRMALILASLLPPRRVAEGHDLPAVQVLVAAHNEDATLPGLLDCLDRLDYPAEKLSFVLVNDGSRDNTATVLEAWCAHRARSCVMHLEENRGKAAALQAALESAQGAELTAIYDADVRPRPDALRKLAEQFWDPRVGAAAGPVLPSNADGNMVSRYAGLELYVFHLVIQAARQQLGWNPPVIGANCMYRTAALVEIGGFPQAAISEDVETSFTLVRRGWRTSYGIGAVVTTSVPTMLSGFWRQRQRWTRGLYRAGWRAGGWSSVLVAAGYVDRLILLAAAVAASFGAMSLLWPLLYLLGPGLAVLIALWRSGERRWVRALLACPPMFIVDVASTLVGTLASLIPAKSRWSTSRGAAGAGR